MRAQISCTIFNHCWDAAGFDTGYLISLLLVVHASLRGFFFSKLLIISIQSCIWAGFDLVHDSFPVCTV